MRQTDERLAAFRHCEQEAYREFIAVMVIIAVSLGAAILFVGWVIYAIGRQLAT